MNDEISIRKLTPEIIEACMDRDTAEIIGRSEEEILAGDVWEEIELFDKLMSSEKISGELSGIPSSARSSPNPRLPFDTLPSLTV